MRVHVKAFHEGERPYVCTWEGCGKGFAHKVNCFNHYMYRELTVIIDPLHKWRLNLNNCTQTSLASHLCENSFVWKHECEAKDVQSIVIQI